jgi:hypothetical protein
MTALDTLASRGLAATGPPTSAVGGAAAPGAAGEGLQHEQNAMQLGWPGTSI